MGGLLPFTLSLSKGEVGFDKLSPKGEVCFDKLSPNGG